MSSIIGSGIDFTAEFRGKPLYYKVVLSVCLYVSVGIC